MFWILEEEVEIPDKRRETGIAIVIAFSAMEGWHSYIEHAFFL
jgi:hypothetical protein